MSRHRRHRHEAAPDEDRVEVALQLLQRMIPSEAKAELKRRYGVCRATAEKYLSQARAFMRGAADINRKEEIGRTLCELADIIHDRSAKHSDRVSAIRTKMRLLGLEAPVRIESSQPPLFDAERERATLKLSHELPAFDTGQDDDQGVDVPPASANGRAGGHGPVELSDR